MRAAGRFLGAICLLCLFLCPVAKASVLDKTAHVNGLTFPYKVVLPNGYDPSKAYPGVLAFPGGPQTLETVERTVMGNWRDEAEKRGYIVIVPAAPMEGLFFEGGDRAFPEFITQLLKDYKILDGKFHIAGVSNGGLSAFHIAASYPQYFLSVTGLPGYLYDSTGEGVAALSKLCIFMYAGELDQDWSQIERHQAAEMRSRKMSVQFSEEKGQPHRMATLEGPGAARLFDQFEQARKGCSN